ncbi:MAG: adenosine deaminase [Bacteroidales bacterium]|nr:adenosine deaminase [Bacteroidales bacterium]
MSRNENLAVAKQNKNDEFYTTYEMIEQELKEHSEYKEQFRDKTIYCNCDNPLWSEFYAFFRDVAVSWGIKRLIFTGYNENITDDDKAFALEWDRTKDKIVTTTKLKPRVHELKGNGDFASGECIEYLKQSDIVVTNPPFSKFRQFFDLLMEYKKDFVLVAPVGALGYKNIFPYIKDSKVQVGYMFGKHAILYSESMFDEEVVPFKCNVCFITTLNLDKPKEDIPLNCLYYGNEEKYPKFDNIDAININKVKDIPKDYYGVMAVPITFLGSYNSEQFKIIDLVNGYCVLDTLGVNKDIKAKKSHGLNINGKATYQRVLIQRISE